MDAEEQRYERKLAVEKIKEEWLTLEETPPSIPEEPEGRGPQETDLDVELEPGMDFK